MTEDCNQIYLLFYFQVLLLWILQLVLDYNDLMKIPVLNDYIRNATSSSIRIRWLLSLQCY
jgi:hypothetical protein